jgi:hypothetical protein
MSKARTINKTQHQQPWREAAPAEGRVVAIAMLSTFLGFVFPSNSIGDRGFSIVFL